MWLQKLFWMCLKNVHIASKEGLWKTDFVIISHCVIVMYLLNFNSCTIHLDSAETCTKAAMESVAIRQRGGYDFATHYDHLCALNNTCPLPAVKAHLSQRQLDINADRIRYCHILWCTTGSESKDGLIISEVIGWFADNPGFRHPGTYPKNQVGFFLGTPT